MQISFRIDQKCNISTDKVKNLFSMLCYQPYNPATTLPSASTSPPMVHFTSLCTCVQCVVVCACNVCGGTCVIDLTQAAQQQFFASTSNLEGHKKHQSEHGQHEAGNHSHHTNSNTNAGQGNPQAPQVITQHTSPTSPHEAALASGISNMGDASWSPAQRQPSAGRHGHRRPCQRRQ
jgi:hypothetical protein